ncbi:MAG: hypothetical protein ACJ0QC_06235 [Flavobacteriales bacterium]|jgi:hypothetical protein
MRIIILTSLFLIPVIGFASFPVKTTTPSDTSIESKKETMEEYKIRIQKQLYKPTEKKYENSIKENKKPIKMSAEGILFSTAIILILTAAIVGENSTKTSSGMMVALYSFLLGLVSLVSSFFVFIFKKIKR